MEEGAGLDGGPCIVICYAPGFANAFSDGSLSSFSICFARLVVGGSGFFKTGWICSRRIREGAFSR